MNYSRCYCDDKVWYSECVVLFEGCSVFELLFSRAAAQNNLSVVWTGTLCAGVHAMERNWWTFWLVHMERAFARSMTIEKVIWLVETSSTFECPLLE